MSQSDKAKPVQLTALQMTSGPDPEKNLQKVAQLLQDLPPQRPQLVVLPEAFSCFGAGDKQQLQSAERFGDGPLQRRLAALAKQHGIWLVAGTIPVVDTDNAERFSAACLVFNSAGELAGRYDKIHLFDVEVADNTRTYHESRYTKPGTKVVTIATEFGRLGLAVCYDVRFPELFRALRDQGCDIMVLPSAFTKVTGAAHWHQLVRARAIEQQCLMVAPGQVGEHANGRETYGHSLIVDGWGTILAEQKHGTGVLSATADISELADIRKRIPVATHNQFKVKYERSA